MRLIGKMIKNIPSGFVVALLVILFYVFCLGLSWIATCGIIKLITMLFGWSFSWGIASAIWLILLLLK
jgi:hypothetical protein